MIKMLFRAAFALSVASLCLPAVAQQPIAAPAGFVPKQAMTFADADGRAVTVSAATPLPVGGLGGGAGGSSGPITYADISVTLSASQSTGAASVLPASTTRKVLMINPPTDCTLRISSGAGGGWPLFGGVPNTIAAGEVPANALYITGLSAGAAVTVWEG
ncbi:hypothetical protein [Sphingomonas prati]|uniref:Uncharacterized protein n=1 Tax=Sphingomonas prati TaxID=1843237 RepID=A0A7W9BRH1_9SPHN|nr:hypothetical protein [Sphingomonas prati]MBB5728258.1 hypothetical protein [Sphingomonas prati]GGE75196.1 hypothetical protein GCM10011404_04720 [Sphingomonas prati]